MKDIIKEKMKHGFVYITGDLHPDSFFEVACLDGDNKKVALIIPNDPNDGVVVTNNDEKSYSFKNYIAINTYLNKNFWRTDLQEIFFCWLIYKKFFDSKYSEFDLNERLNKILEDTKNIFTKNFVITLNDNLNAVSHVDCAIDEKDLDTFNFRIHVNSIEELAQNIKNKRDDLYQLASKIHSIAFEIVWANALGEEESEKKKLHKQIFQNKRIFASLVQQRYDFDFNISDTDFFNKVVMPATKLE